LFSERDPDPSRFFGKIGEVVTDDLLRAPFLEAAVDAARRFSWERTGGAVLDLFESLAMEQPQAAACVECRV
jgi:hypothetical protein